MPGKSGARGQGHGGAGHGKPKRDWMGDDGRLSEAPPIDQGRPLGPGENAGRLDNRGRSESSPGHLKRTAGARSARDFAAGHTDGSRSSGG